MKARDLALLRLAAQRIAGPGFGSATEAVHWLTAVQAQDFPGAITSVALRTQARTAESVHAALNSGEVVRSWPMRGTLHFTTASDLPWMLGLTGERMIASAARRRAELNIDAADLDKAGQLMHAALEGGGRLTRKELFTLWEEAGQLTGAQRGAHLLFPLTVSGLVCLGPKQGNDQQLVLTEEWIKNPRRLERDEALGEWALRYFRSHGPATVKDFAWWTKLVMADVKAAVAIAAPSLERIEVDGTEYYLDPQTPARLDEVRSKARGVFLLPGFDEYQLGYVDRSAALPAEFAQRVVPGSNGMFLSTVVSGGQVVGTWKRAGRGREQSALATPFTHFTSTVDSAIPRLFQALP